MDTDPNSEVSALLDALDETPELEPTAEGSEGESQEAEQATSAADEQQQEEATDDANEEAPAPLVIEFDGKQWELPPGTPPELAEGVKKVADDLKADYTRKRQAAAEEERQVRESAKTLQELSQIAQATHAKSAELMLMGQQLRAIEQTDWNALAEANPAEGLKLQAAYQRLQRQMQQAQQELQQLAHTERQKLDGEKQRRRAEVIQKAPEVIPGFNEKVNQELLQTVMHVGFAAEEVAELADVRMLKLINLARLGLQFQQQAKPAALKKVAEAPRVVKPQAPLPRRENQSALDRLKKTGRAEELVSFL